jgi:hypothetical protein
LQGEGEYAEPRIETLDDILDGLAALGWIDAGEEREDARS